MEARNDSRCKFHSFPDGLRFFFDFFPFFFCTIRRPTARVTDRNFVAVYSLPIGFFFLFFLFVLCIGERRESNQPVVKSVERSNFGDLDRINRDCKIIEMDRQK